MLRYLITLIIAAFLFFTTSAGPTEPADTLSGTFNLMTMGVDGTPGGRGQSDADKKDKTMYIAMVITLSNYAIVHVQEDFNYHETLYQYSNYRYRTETSGIFPSGSGLNTLSKYNWTDFKRVKWDLCSKGCLGQQGFTFMRVQIDRGVYIDMINLDTNAGAESSNQVARRSNIKQVSNFINTNSVGNAVIVFGNTNSLYTSSQDNIRLFNTENQLIDAWVQSVGGEVPTAGTKPLICPKGIPASTNCEVIDKVLYRGSPLINLNSLRFIYDTSRFLSPEGKLLTERNPVRVEFAWNLRAGIQQSDLYGGPYGTWFNDLPQIPSSPRVSSITIRGAARLDGISINLISGQNFTHGGSGGAPSQLILSPEEYIVSVEVCWGQRNGHTRNFYARATTNKNHYVEAGTSTKDCMVATAPKGYGVVGTYGQDGNEMDQLGFIYIQQ
ncbi:putative protein Mb0912 [Mycobacterium bovis AF2122/97] [Rhizoctonia solani]|uniref:Jacalin-type lectin domain-containing protein n=1 Tax=Rhizoctonia solani TaxID=456999 RepID=A0A0K6GF34_9AGAM|nr:putative protein Mb0912 [Mycobacterium bovis AF2122/97] [Rhizoctonia solani]